MDKFYLVDLESTIKIVDYKKQFTKYGLFSCPQVNQVSIAVSRRICTSKS